MSERERLSATVEREVMEAARLAVSEGRASSVSSWVNAAMHREAAHDQRLRSLAAFVEEFEAQHGELTAIEVREAVHRARGQATAVRDATRSAS